MSLGEALSARMGPSRRSTGNPTEDMTLLPDLYFSGDVETDGPIPGPYSMLSMAFVIVGSYDGTVFRKRELGVESFYCELKPISPNFQEDAMSVNGLDRDALIEDGREPADAMNQAASWIDHKSPGYNPIFVGYPAMFDWMWLFWYFDRFATRGSPFGFSGCMDIKTLLASRTRVPLGSARRSLLPSSLRSAYPHTHNALDDAIAQGDLFARLMTWEQ